MEQKQKEIDFLKGMIAHHQSALAMSLPMIDGGRLESFAMNIVLAQSKEINQMKRWLKEWYDIDFDDSAEVTTAMKKMPGM